MKALTLNLKGQWQRNIIMCVTPSLSIKIVLFSRNYCVTSMILLTKTTLTNLGSILNFAMQASWAKFKKEPKCAAVKVTPLTEVALVQPSISAHRFFYFYFILFLFSFILLNMKPLTEEAPCLLFIQIQIQAVWHTHGMFMMSANTQESSIIEHTKPSLVPPK